jgi:hypothetical protein
MAARCPITVLIDGEVYARFRLQTDAEIFAKAFSREIGKPATVDSDVRESPRTYIDGEPA